MLDQLDMREGEARPRVALRTVQEVLERAVRQVVREPVILQGASRTDSGVHARGQVAAFTCSDGDGSSEASPRGGGWPASRGVERLVRAINGRLPEDVVVRGGDVVHGQFDPVNDAVEKAYSYTFQIGQERALFDRQYVHHIWEHLDAGAMHAAAQHLVGEHDFVALAALHHGRLTTVRTIFACEVRDVDVAATAEGIAAREAARPAGAQRPRRVRIDVRGSGFLYNMVRIIAGTLFEVGRGRMRAEDVPAILASKDRRRAGPTMPARGLCLEWMRHRACPDD